jgi:hypothetical protein
MRLTLSPAGRNVLRFESQTSRKKRGAKEPVLPGQPGMQNGDPERDRNRLVRFVHGLAAGNKVVFSVILVSAVLLTAARTLAQFEVGKDQATQLEAALILTAGSGLTTTNDVLPRSYDIIDVRLIHTAS